jgi:PhzF family phenazine biosynthesis protein
MERIDGRIHGRMRQRPLRLLPPLSDVTALAAALGIRADEILTTPPPRAADTGGTHLLVRVRDASVVDRIVPAHQALLEVLRDAGAEGCYAYSFDPSARGHAYARFFNPTVGLWEDAATGTAAGPLAAYLGREHLLADNRLIVEQGVKMGRRSLLNIRLAPDPELSGAGLIVLRGTLQSPR